MTTDYDAVVGAGHDGLIAAAYLARDGLRTLLVEARPTVGGTAGGEPLAGGTVDLCSCDHVTFRTTPVMDELDLAAFGLRYVDLDPSQVSWPWSGGPAWRHFHDVDETIDELARTYPDDVDGYHRYVRAARPAAHFVLEAANETPTLAGLTDLSARTKLRGVPTVLRWSRRSAAAVLGDFFATDALVGPAVVGGPMVWGVSPTSRGTGLGALVDAMRHVAQLGRPVGGSGQLAEAVRAAFEHHGGEVRTSTKVRSITCTGERVGGVTLDDGEDVTAGIVVSACDPRRTFVEWLRDRPAAAERMIGRWRDRPAEPGYESKIDAIVSRPPRLRAIDHDLGATLTVAPALADVVRAAAMLDTGGVLERPAMFVNVPSVADPTVAPPGKHVFSMEILWTPYRHPWESSAEPQRWLELFAGVCEPGFLDSIEAWRAMTPDVYERDLHLPSGHATSFRGGPLAALRAKDPELSRYETTIDGLYLTGAATFPGAGIWGASGRNCAAVIRLRQE